MIELIYKLSHNYIMKKITCLIIIYFLFSLSGICKNTEKPDNFTDLGRYTETFELNESDNEITTKEDDEKFEQEALIDIAKRYEENAVELKLDDIDEENISNVNSERLFKLRVNETQYNIEQNIKNENMIWDGSKAFSQAFINNSRHMAPIPSVINSQNIEAKVSPSLSAKLGQTYLFDSFDSSVLFVRSNESTYNTGSVISYKGDGLNIACGSFSSSYNNASSGGAIIKSNPLLLPNNCGSFAVGSALFSNEGQEFDKTTGGVFTEYKYKRLKLNTQVGQSRYSNSTNPETSIYFIPELRLTDSIYIKTRFIRNITQNTMQDEMALTYKPKHSKNNLEFEINASNQYDQNSTIKQRLKLTTSFRI